MCSTTWYNMMMAVFMKSRYTVQRPTLFIIIATFTYVLYLARRTLWSSENSSHTKIDIYMVTILWWHFHTHTHINRYLTSGIKYIRDTQHSFMCVFWKFPVFQKLNFPMYTIRIYSLQMNWMNMVLVVEAQRRCVMCMCVKEKEEERMMYK